MFNVLILKLQIWWGVLGLRRRTLVHRFGRRLARIVWKTDFWLERVPGFGDETERLYADWAIRESAEHNGITPEEQRDLLNEVIGKIVCGVTVDERGGVSISVTDANDEVREFTGLGETSGLGWPA